MTQEQKELLLKDLCARLPYDVKCYNNKYKPDLPDTIVCIVGKSHVQLGTYLYKLEDIKPYLFPLSSMTEEQKKEFDQLIELELKAISDEIDHTQATEFEVDFYNKHNFDWRGLIPLGLAIDATGLNIY